MNRRRRSFWRKLCTIGFHRRMPFLRVVEDFTGPTREWRYESGDYCIVCFTEFLLEVETIFEGPARGLEDA